MTIDINPSLDYLMQYPVNAVITDDMPNGYGIEFQGNAIIGLVKPAEGELVVPEGLAGKQLITVVRSDTGVRMIFGNVRKDQTVEGQVEVEAAPNRYFICDPRFGGEAFYPDAPQGESAEDRAQSVREQFSGAFADGPDTPDFDAPLSQMIDDPNEDDGA